MIFPFCSALVRSHLSVLGTFPVQERCGHTKVVKGLEHLTREKLRQLRMFNLEKRRLRAGFINVYKYPKGEYKEDGAVWALCRVAQ